MKITIKKEVFKKFHPKLRIAFILVKGVDNQKLKEAQHLLEELTAMTKLLHNKDTIKNNDLISPWKILQEEFGKEAKHYHTSVERLMKKVISKRKVKSPLTIINLINYLSLKYIVPIAFDDLAKVQGDIVFEISKGKEKVSILKKLKKNALYYKDSKKVLGTKLDYWKSKKSKPDRKTTDFLIHIEVLPPATKKLKENTQELVNLIKTFCGGKIKTAILSSRKNSIKI